MNKKNKIIGATCVIIVMSSYYILGVYANITEEEINNMNQSVNNDISLQDNTLGETMTNEPKTLMETTEVNSVEPVNELTDEPILINEPIMIEDKTNKNLIYGNYIGNGYIMIGKTKVKVISKYLSNVKEGDEVSLEIKGNIKSFNILSVSVNGIKVVPDSVIVKNKRPSAYQSGIFLIKGVYSNGKIGIEVGDKIKMRILNVRNSANYEGKTIELLIRGTINDFKVVGPIKIIE